MESNQKLKKKKKETKKNPSKRLMTKTNKINRKSRAKIRNEKKEEKIILT